MNVAQGYHERRRNRSLGVAVVGPLPPPRHGVSAINESVTRSLGELNVSVINFDTAPPSLRRDIFTRLRRASVVAIALLRYFASLMSGNIRCLYISASGGFGLIYETMFVLIGRLLRQRIFVHHNSYRYINENFFPMRLLKLVAGKDGYHIMLAHSMASAFRSRYGECPNVMIISNAAFVGAPRDFVLPPEREAPFSVGILANLSKCKGLDDFIEVARRVRHMGLPWCFRVAGPFEEPSTMEKYLMQFESYNIDYLGPVYEMQKEDFFLSIDVFLFPTRYFNEAEPLAILESLKFGKPVISFRRGCIEEMLGNGGCVFDVAGGAHEDVHGAVIQRLKDWEGNREIYYCKCRDAAERYRSLHEDARNTFEEVLSMMSKGVRGRR